MQTNLYFRVCIACRNVNAQYTEQRDDEGTLVARICKSCGGQVVLSPYKWAPPKKTNDRAWKRIEKGEWLWDRRRVRRGGYWNGNWVHWNWEQIPNQKKGTPGRHTGGYYSDAQVELGG